MVVKQYERRCELGMNVGLHRRFSGQRTSDRQRHGRVRENELLVLQRRGAVQRSVAGPLTQACYLGRVGGETWAYEQHGGELLDSGGLAVHSNAEEYAVVSLHSSLLASSTSLVAMLDGGVGKRWLAPSSRSSSCAVRRVARSSRVPAAR